LNFLCGFKITEIFGKAGVFSPSFGSRHLYLMEQQKEKAKKSIFCGDKESDDMVSDLNKMEYLEFQQMLFELEPENCKDGQHNEKLWRDGFVQAILWLVINDININR
jgi:hypothetical protein